MTKAKGLSILKYLNVHCDDAFMFVGRVGTGCVTGCKSRGSAEVLFTLLINMIDKVFEAAKDDKEFRVILLQALIHYLSGVEEEPEDPVKREENLTPKQLARRMKNNERTLNELEKVLG